MSILEETIDFLHAFYRLDASKPITGTTPPTDIPGWDSLSSTMLALALEQRFAVELPAECVFEAGNVAALASVITAAKR